MENFSLLKPNKCLRMQDLPNPIVKRVSNPLSNEPISRPELIQRAVKMSDVPDKSRLDKYLENLYNNKTLRASTKLWEMIPSGYWKNRRCFVIGGGTSLKGFDFNKLRGELVITVNRAFENVPFSVINIAQDARLWGWYENGQLGNEAKDKFYKYEGFKTWLNVQAFPFPEDVFQLVPIHVDDFNWEKPKLDGGIPIYGNSGLNALTVALCLGASPIYLLGFDMYGKEGRTANYHSGYPDSNDEKVYKNNFLEDFNDFAWRVKNTEIINLNPKSALKCFEFGNIDKIPKIKRPKLVSFYTLNTGYQREKDRLKNTARMFGYEVDFYEQEGTGSWRSNIHDRIRILRHFLNKYDDDILYIDCDAEMTQYPILFDNWDKGDLGIVKIDRSKYWTDWQHGHPDKYEYLGGTMYLKNNNIIRKLLNLWEKIDAPMDTQLSQHTLIKVIESMPELKINLLPLTYTQIFDTMAGEGEPVIEHFQASRRGLLYLKADGKGDYKLDFGNGEVSG